MSSSALLASTAPATLDYGVAKGALLSAVQVQTAGGALTELITFNGAGGAGTGPLLPYALTTSMTMVLVPSLTLGAGVTQATIARTSANSATITQVGGNVVAGFYTVLVFA